jgi:hypothetical protein
MDKHTSMLVWEVGFDIAELWYTGVEISFGQERKSSGNCCGFQQSKWHMHNSVEGMQCIIKCQDKV